MKFASGNTNQVITGNIQGVWDPDISVAVITAVGIPVEEVLLCIGMNDRRAVINLERDCEEDLLKSL